MALDNYRFKRFLNTHRGERIDQPDLQHAVETQQRDALSQIGEGFLVGDKLVLPSLGIVEQPRLFVLYGFQVTNPATTQLTVTGGSGLLGSNENGNVVSGLLINTEVTGTRTIDIGTYANGDYGIFIRLEMREENYENRAFWNADASTPAEYSRVVPTRIVEDWNVVVETSSPGAEWLQIYAVNKAGSVLTLTDMRDYFFEGRADLDYDPANEWGSTSDRADTRNLSGITGLRRFVRAVQKQLDDIIDSQSASGGWWSLVRDSAGSTIKSLYELTQDKLERDGSNEISGDILPDANITHELGSSVRRFLTIFAQDFTGSGTLSIPTVDAATEVTAPFATVSSNAAAPLTGADVGRLYRDMVPMGWFRCTTNTTGSVTAFTEVGVAITIAGNNLRVTLDNAATSSTAYAVIGNVQGIASVRLYNISRISATQFDLIVHTDLVGGTGIVGTTEDYYFDFVIYGRPA